MAVSSVDASGGADVVTDWAEISPQRRLQLVQARASQLKQLWVDYFESWSTDQAFASHGAYEPLEIASELGVEGASELIERLREIGIHEGVEDARGRYELALDKCVKWVTTFHPVVTPELVEGAGFFLSNTPEFREKLRRMDSNHVWSIVWGDVEYLKQGFLDTEDDETVIAYCVTLRPSDPNGLGVCDLAAWVNCLICDGDGYSDAGDSCLACDSQGQFLVDFERVLKQRVGKVLPESLVAEMGWL